MFLSFFCPVSRIGKAAFTRCCLSLDFYQDFVMKNFLLLFSLLFIVCTTQSFAQNRSNKGKEFWVGYGHNQLFSSNGETFVLYLSAEQSANVTVSVPSVGYSQSLIIPANSAIQTAAIPKTARLTAEGMSTAGIHILSDVPIVAYAHQYGGSSSGATMLMPVETYGYTYYSLNYTQITNSTPAYSWFFVVASEDNTTVQITPSDVTQGNRPANVPFTVNLNKGQIYNVFGQASGNSGNDMTGSKIVSVAGTDGNCHPIGVFSGSSRMTICNTSSGEFMQQQIFPASAWGTRYLTYPTVSTSNINTKNINFYRIAVRDPSTVVKRNGVVLTGLNNNFYYDFESNDGEYIEADRPILVEQLIPSTSTPCNVSGYPSYSGLGDPEMFYLSPIEQSIKKAVFYNTSNQSISNNYVSVIIPYAAAASGNFKIDGTTSYTFKAHPQNAAYAVVVKAVTVGQHTVSSDSAFTAITYGLGSVESYGYNAGTLVNDLTSAQGLQNDLTPVTVPGNATCKNTPFELIASLTYAPTKMVWKLSQAAPALQPVNIDTTVNNPVAFDTVYVNGLRYYRYRLPRTYTFNQTGSYTIPITVTSPDIDNCSNSIDININLTVGLNPVADFNVTYSGCQADTAYLFGTYTANGNNITQFRWDFEDNTTDNLQNTKKKFNTDGAHAVRFRVISDVGCIGDTTKNVNTIPPPVTVATPNPSSVCANGSVTFTPVSSFPGGAIDSWYWDFGDGTPVQHYTNSNPVSHTFTTAMHDDTIRHWILGVGGCKSETLKIPLRVWANPVTDFDAVTVGCLEDSTAFFADKTTIADGQTLTWAWSFGDAANSTPANPNTSSLQNPSHRYKYVNNYNINLVATTVEGGCSVPRTKTFNVPGFINPIVFTIQNENTLCSNVAVNLVNGMDVVVNGISKFEIYWDTLGAPTVYDTYNNPSNNQSFTHTYPTFTTPLTKDYTIKLVVYSQGGCISSRYKTITLNAKPDLYFNVLQGVCVNGSPKFVGNASLLNAVSGGGVYSGLGVLADTTINPAVAGVGYHAVKYKYTTTFGCTDSVSKNIYVFPKPVAKFVFNKNVCQQDSVLFTDQSTISNGQAIQEWHWDFGNTTTKLYTNPGNTFINEPPFYNHYTNYGSFPATLYVVSDSACLSDVTAPQTVTIYPDPVTAFLPPQGLCVPSGQANFINQSTYPTGSSSQLTYVWDFGDGTTSTAVDPVHFYTTGVPPYTVKLTATSPLGCIVTNTQVLNQVFQDPVSLFVFNSDTLCEGRPLFFEDKSTTGIDPITKWHWDFGNNDTINQQNVTKAFAIGSYTATLKVTTSNGCTSNPDHTEAFSIYKQPIVDAGPNMYTPEGKPVVIAATSNDNTNLFKYIWTPSIYLNDDTLLNPICSPIFTTTYKLLAYGGGGNCIATDTVKIIALKQLAIPNAFSPNGDGINDKWDINFLNDYPNCKIEIFNRNGQQVYRSIGYNGPWDGRFNGNPLPVGTYYYIIELNNNGYGKLSGSVTIIK